MSRAGPSAMTPGQALARIKAAVRAQTIEVSLHAEAGHPERGITVMELFASLLAAGSIRQQGPDTV